MRLTRAIDAFLEWGRVERDWTPRTIDSVYRTLSALADRYPDATLADFDGRAGTDKLRVFIGEKWGRKSATTRATRISYLHSFFAWAEDEELIEDDPARRIKRPPKRKPDVYRPNQSELALLLSAATARELPALLLMAGAGLRASEVVALTWARVDLLNGRVRVQRKGGHRQTVPIDPLVLDQLRQAFRLLEPDLDDYVFTAETEQWISQEHRVRRVIDAKTPRSPKALWTMVRRIFDS